MIEKQIELEKRMTEICVEKFKRDLASNCQKDNFSNTKTGNVVLSVVIDTYIESIKNYLNHYAKGNAIRCTIAAETINRVGADKAGYIAAKVILNSLKENTAQSVYRAVGQALEDEYKMQKYRKENKHYYDTIQRDLNSRGAKANRKKYITMNVFGSRLDFHLEKWSITEKIQTGMILVNLFETNTQLITIRTIFKGKKQTRVIESTEHLKKYIEDINNKLEVLEPFFLPMVCKPKDWTDIFNGGYLSPYLKRNKVIKNNNKEYLIKLKSCFPTKVYEALNIIQSTSWQINKDVLNIIEALWEEGNAIAGLPKREDDIINPFPYPDITKDTELTPYQKEVIKRWKQETYETHKKNVTQRSLRLLTSQILRIAEQFKEYPKIWFPYQMDFRGRMYPIPVLLHPQGSDLAKGLLKFGEGKPLTDEKAKEWFFVHGANVFGYDKVSYKDRIQWVNEHREEILKYATSPLLYRGWAEADKPIQFLAWCIEFCSFNDNPNEFITYIPIQLDGTCNGLQHYSALLRDEIAGKSVNLINSTVPNDIYSTVAEKLKEKLNELSSDSNINNKPCNVNNSNAWINLGINRKLTKRPVMVLPYGGSRQSCREYIQEYLEENYSIKFLWEYFKQGKNPTDCIYKVSLWLSNFLWEAIRDVLKSAVIGMAYIKTLTREVLKHQNYLEWYTPLGLLIHQAYQNNKKREIKTELFGKHIKTKFTTDSEGIDKQRQLNGICPNFIHSLDASCLMLWLLKCREKGITSFMSVHDCYATLASDTEKSAELLREAFVEIYKHPILDNFETDLIESINEELTLPEKPQQGLLDINEVLKSKYFFN